MAPQPTMDLLFSLLFAVIPAASLAWLWYLVLRKLTMQHAVCGHCQYIVEGLQTMYCPECGSDFRKVGIVTPRRQAAIKPAFFQLAWLVLLTPFALSMSGAVIAMGRIG